MTGNGRTGKPSVLLVGSFLSASGGSRQVCEELAPRLSAAGLSVLTTSSKPGRAARLADMVSTCWRERRRYTAAQVDVFSGPAFIWAEAVCWTLRRAGKPYILTLHGGGLPEFFRRRPNRARALLHSAAAVTVPSGFLLEKLRSYRPDMLLIPNALEVSRYAFRPRSNPRPELTWLRAFHPVYNPMLAVQAAARLAGEFAGLKLTMTGPDKGEGALEETRALCDSLGLNGRVTFRGPVPKDQVPEAIGAGDIYLNTTNADNTPVTVLEAMATGACVVTTRVGGIPYLVEDGAEALLVPPGDPAAMAAAIRRILTEPGLAARLSDAGRKKAELFDWNTVLPRWISLFESVSGRECGQPGYQARRDLSQ